MTKSLSTLACAAACLWLAAGGYAAEPAPGTFAFRYDNGRCWLQANEASVNAILTEVSDASGIPIHTDPASDDKITVTLEGRDIEQLIKAIATGSVITYVRDPDTGREFIEEIVTSRSVDQKTKNQQLRELESRRQLEGQQPVRPDQPLRYSGIGARVAVSQDRKSVQLFPMSPDAPSARAGIAPGQVVVAIDGKPVSEFADVGQMAAAIRGPVGTTVILTVRLPNGRELTKSIQREVYEYKPR